MKTMKKFISTTFICLFTAISGFAQTYSGGSGSETSPFLISSKADMEALATAVNGGNNYSGKYFLLTRDLTGVNDTITTIIGTSDSNYFGGTFDGGNHEIAVKIHMGSSSRFVGVFAYISDASIKNVRVTGSISCSSTAYSYSFRSGGICGQADNSIIVNSSNTSTVFAETSDRSYSTTSYVYSGGICGFASGSTITNCSNTGNIDSHSISAATASGGICGWADGTISDCHNTGNISAESAGDRSPHSGGICGRGDNDGIITIANCYNTGSISVHSPNFKPESYSGGICGLASMISIIYCYNTGNISADEASAFYIGGICGKIDSFYTPNTISNCYNTGNVSTSSTYSGYYYTYSGGICGRAETVTNCYNTGNISTSSTYTAYSNAFSGGICGLAGTAVTNCYNTGNISSTSTSISISTDFESYSGGICGSMWAKVNNCFAANATITTDATTAYIERISPSTTINSYALSSMTLNGSTVSSEDATSKNGKDASLSNFQFQTWIVQNLAWDFDTVWKMSDINSAHQGFPVLKALNDATSIPAIKNTYTISVSPNPATDIITITGLQINEPITIHDLSGKLVLSRKAVGATESIAVGGLPKGVYLVGIAGQTVKLVKK
jgi:hypothetical protein